MTQPIWTNEEQVIGGPPAPETATAFNERFVGMRIQTDFRTFHIDEAGGGESRKGC